MSTLLANQAIEAAIAAILVQCGVILGIFAAYLKVRTTQAVQGEKIDAVQKQQDKQASAVLVTPLTPIAPGALPMPAAPTPPVAAAAPADVAMGHAAHLAAAQAGLKQAHEALALLLASPGPGALPSEPETTPPSEPDGAGVGLGC